MQTVDSPIDPPRSRRRGTPAVGLLVGSEDGVGRWDRALLAVGVAPLLTESADEALALLSDARRPFVLALLGPEVTPAQRRAFLAVVDATCHQGRRVALVVLVSEITVEEMVTLLRSGADEVLLANTLTEPVLVARLTRLSHAS